MGKYFLTRSLISARKHSEFHRETRSFEDVDLRPAQVEGQRTNNCTALVLRPLYASTANADLVGYICRARLLN